MARVWTIFGSRRTTTFVGTLLLLAGVVTVSANVNPLTEDQRAQAWVANHQGVLPTTLEGIAAYPVTYQHEIFASLPAAEKSRLWREQLQRVLAYPNVTTEQKAFIREAMALATPESFGPLGDHPEVCERIAQLFPDKNTKRMFLRLGAIATPSFAWRSAMVTLTENIRSKIVISADVQDDCNCRGYGYCECGLYDGCADAPNCRQTNNCGCIWAGPCDLRICQNAIGNMAATSTTTTTTTTTTTKKK